jgi:hypothetical protein
MNQIEAALTSSDPIWETIGSQFADDEQPLPAILAQLVSIVGQAAPLFVQTRIEHADQPGELKIVVFAIWDHLVTSTTFAEGSAGTTVVGRRSLRSVQLRSAPVEGREGTQLEGFLSYAELGDIRVPSNREHAPLREQLSVVFPLLMADLAS